MSSKKIGIWNFVFCVAIFSWGCAPASFTPPPSIYIKDYQVKKLVDDKKIEEALDLYSQMLEEADRSSSIHSNIGASLAHLKKNEDALKSLTYALNLAQRQNNKTNEFAIHYNLGVYFGKANIALALEHYQKALDIVPWHKETRQNIELLFQDGQNQEKGDSSENSQGGGQGQQQNQNENQDQQNQQKDEQKNDQGKDQTEKENQPQQKKDSPKYKPRPFQGEKLSEGDVKKILGELKNQEQKIRANFDKKEKKDSKNEKDW